MDCARWEIKLAEQVAVAESGKASSNNPVECLKFEVGNKETKFPQLPT
ncbi:TPA: hypothetical protein U2C31_001347 [Streptococcus suis]|nr:hypothetical protein [Streptococcus suis]MCL4898098.1 hypothetical protein [Streptococcus suis]MDW8714732.1 hypothetical protein [Streptococcus suis]HEM3170464.1 hypothetical protein [Streptococcus suis]HEM4262299.1 hypothetical protein [Streptococcus suis]HEM6091337.1 hypothetical protein [Streptococcus suis]